MGIVPFSEMIRPLLQEEKKKSANPAFNLLF